MIRAPRALILAALTLATLIVTEGPLQAGPATLTPDEMRAFGLEALAKGYAEQALQIADALLARDAGDSTAYILRAQALRVLHRLPESEAAARTGWAKAGDKGTRYAAATAVAQALSLQNHRQRAQFWLRQAVQNAPNPAARAQALQDFSYVREQNPLSLNLTTALQPSDNVNGGTRISSFDLGGITFPVPGSLEALSGLTWSFGIEGGYRLAASPQGATRLTFGATQQGVFLSDAARTQAPEAENADYALSHLELGLERKLVLPQGLLTLGLVAGHNWYAGKPLSDSLEASASLDRPMGEGSVSYGATVTRQLRLDQGSASSNAMELSASTTQTGPAGDRWTGGLTLIRSISGDAGVDHSAAALSLAWQARQPVAGLHLGANMALQGSEYDGNGRRDGRWSAGLNATFDKATYLGFAPVLNLTVAQNNSNFLLYTTRSFGLGLSIRSRF